MMTGLLSAPFIAVFVWVGIRWVQKGNPESGLSFSVRDGVVLTGIAFFCAISFSALFKGWSYMHILWISGYLMLMSYTDLKTGMVYTLFSKLFFAAETIIFLLFLFFGGGGWSMGGTTILGLLLFMAVNFIAGKLNLLGMGDVYIFSVMALFYCNISRVPAAMLLLNAFLAYFMFGIWNLPQYLKHKDFKMHLPFTAELALGAYFTMLLERFSNTL